MQRSGEKIDLVIPEYLESNPSCKLERVNLLGGSVVSRYSGTGTLIVSSIKSRASQVFQNDTATTSNGNIAFSDPYVFTLINGNIHIFNSETCTSERIVQDTSLVENVRCLLANNRYLVGVGVKQILVWRRDTMASQPPRVIDAASQQQREECGSIEVISEFSTLNDENKLVIVNGGLVQGATSCLYQVWDVVEDQLAAWAKCPAVEAGDSFVTFSCNTQNSTIIATTRARMFIWDITRHVTAGGRQLISPKDIPQNNVITAVHAGGNLIVIGDHNGLVTLLDAHGEPIYALCAGRDKGPAEYENMPLIDLPTEAYKNKVNQVLRVGRWVVASLDNGRIELYDIFSELADEPVDTYLNPGSAGGGGGSSASGAREITVFDRKVVALYTANPKEASKGKSGGKIKPDVVCWSPKTTHESFEFFAGLPRATWAESPLRVVAESMRANAKMLGSREEFADHCAKLRESVIRLEEFDSIQAKADATLPFQFVQDLMENCDIYAKALRKITKGAKIARHKDSLDAAARNFYGSLEMISSITDFVGEVKSCYTSGQTSRMIPAFNTSEFGEDGMGGDGSGGQGGSQGDGQSSSAASAAAAAAASSRSRDEGDAKIEAMLGELIAGLGVLKNRTAVALEDYDATCEGGISDPDLIMPLLDVYTRLRQFNEDLKETALEAAVIRKENIKGQWYAEGGIYDDDKPEGAGDDK